MKRIAPFFILLVAAAVVFAAKTPSMSDDVKDLTVHEWGTFTSVAGANGEAVEWAPAGGPNDLPCFVDRMTDGRILSFKGALTGTVRMETPVLYFYSPKPATVDVHVSFRQGLMSEWFPDASVQPQQPGDLHKPGFSGTIAWKNVKILSSPATFPSENRASHYYAARNTDANALEVGSQKEKFLFYRGLGSFALPIAATVEAGDRIHVRKTGNEPVGAVVLFENRGGKFGFRVSRDLQQGVTLDRPVLSSDFASLRAELERMLVAQGLYPKEAKAMVDTWKDSWFEDGSRLFYIVPQSTVDSVLPLEIQPSPAKIARVFVGRLELVTAATQAEVENAIRNNNRAGLEKYGRFLEPIMSRLYVSTTLSAAEKRRGSDIAMSIRSSYVSAGSSCSGGL